MKTEYAGWALVRPGGAGRDAAARPGAKWRCVIALPDFLRCCDLHSETVTPLAAAQTDVWWVDQAALVRWSRRAPGGMPAPKVTGSHSGRHRSWQPGTRPATLIKSDWGSISTTPLSCSDLSP